MSFFFQKRLFKLNFFVVIVVFNLINILIPNFVKADSIAPKLKYSVPMDDAVAVDNDSNSIRLVFDEDIIGGRGDEENIKIYIRKYEDDSIFEESPRYDISSNQVVIRPDKDFANGVSYYVEIGSQAFMDTSGNFFEGISGKEKLNFTSNRVFVHNGDHVATAEYHIGTVFQLGLTNDDGTKTFQILNEPNGVLVDFAQEGESNLATNIKPEPGDYTHIYALISSTYKIKAKSENNHYITDIDNGTGAWSFEKPNSIYDDNAFKSINSKFKNIIKRPYSCYTKSGASVNNTNSSFKYKRLFVSNGALYQSNLNPNVDEYSYISNGFLAGTSNPDEYGEASLTELSFGVSDSGLFDEREQHYGPTVPSTNISTQGVGVSEIAIYKTNSNDPFSIFPKDSTETPPLRETRDRTYLLGKLQSPIQIKENSKGTINFTFKFNKGLNFSDDCSAIVYEPTYFNMNVFN